MINRIVFLFIALLGLSSCATSFPTPSSSPADDNAGLTADQLFGKTFNAHGGEHLSELHNVNIALEGEWKHLIRRIQPLVTDFGYRVKSQERLLLKKGIYRANYEGPEGSKHVFRTSDTIKVWYNDTASTTADVLSSTALTADSFYLFLLGPLALDQSASRFELLSDARLNNKTLHRLYLERKPGFGFSKRDQVVLWIDRQTFLTKMIQITLEGHDTTKGAHVEVEYLDYITLDNYTFPSDFFERVKAPIAIDAHGWRLTGLDINRDYSTAELETLEMQGNAAIKAAPLK